MTGIEGISRFIVLDIEDTSSQFAGYLWGYILCTLYLYRYNKDRFLPMYISSYSLWIKEDIFFAPYFFTNLQTFEGCDTIQDQTCFPYLSQVLQDFSERLRGHLALGHLLLIYENGFDRKFDVHTFWPSTEHVSLGRSSPLKIDS